MRMPAALCLVLAFAGAALAEEDLAAVERHVVSAAQGTREREGVVRVPVRLDPKGSGRWERTGDGGLVWRLRIASPGAALLGLEIDPYSMPRGGRLVIRSADGSEATGPFTDADTPIHARLLTPPVPGEEILVEVTLPRGELGRLRLRITSVAHFDDSAAGKGGQADEETPPAPAPEDETSVAAVTPCAGGMAGAYPCNGIDLYARVPLSAFGGNPASASNLWGYVDLDDNREYAIIGLRNGTGVVDVTDPANPVVVGTVAGPSSQWREVKVYQRQNTTTGKWDGYAYVTTEASGAGIQIIDLTNLPTSVSLAGTWSGVSTSHTALVSNVDWATSVANNPSFPPHLYINGANVGGGGFRIVSLANPTSLTEVGAFTGAYTHDIYTHVFTDARANQCAAGHNPCEVAFSFSGSSGLKVVDVTNKSALTTLSTFTYPQLGYCHSGWIAPNNQYLMLHDETDEQSFGFNTRVRTVNIGSLTAPSLSNVYTGPTAAIDHNGYTKGNKFYYASYTRGLAVLDVSNANAPTEVAFFDTYPSSNGASFAGAWGVYPYLPSGTLIISDIQSGLFVVREAGGTPTPDFSLSANPPSLAVNAGSNATSTITVTSVNGFSAAVTLSASGLPSGVTASFSPGVVTPPAGGSATSTLTLAAAAGAPSSTSTVAIAGTSGSTSRSTSVSLTVNGAGTAIYDATLKAPKCAAVGSVCDSGPSLLLGRDGKGPEPNQPNTVNNSCADGTSGTFHSDESNDRLKVATTDGTPFASGKTVRIEATVWAWTTPSSDKLDLYYAANAASPTWTFVTTLTPAAAGAQPLSATYTLPAGSLQAVRAQFRYQGSASACTSGGYNDRDDLVFAVGGAPPDTTPPTTSITSPTGGATVGGTVNVTASASDNVGVTSVEFLVDGAVQSTDTTSPYGFSWDTTTYGNGTHTLQSRAFDAAGNTGTSALVTVTVNNGAGAQTAVYDSTLGAPKCGVVGISCDSGASLLLGRDGKGPEPNQPNTVNSSCTDGTSGTFHSDESNDRIKVATTDGTPLAAGKTVRIEATVWAWTTPSSDKLDLYYAANAASPTWTFLTTLTPTAAGAQTLSATYTLPSGSLQAVRARFRYLGSAAACGTGSYNDHDDLVFAVQ